jgi:3-hydroxyisobutyrate dehydrogenase-like beta-hydroxyacid dehydrogenase
MPRAAKRIAARVKLFEAIAGRVFHVGDRPGLGQIAKLANNMISAAGMAAACEAAALAVKAGLDAATLIEVVNAGTGRNTATTDKFPRSILPRSFDYGGRLATMYKDVRLCLEEAERRGVPMWVGSSVVQLWFEAMFLGVSIAGADGARARAIARPVA